MIMREERPGVAIMGIVLTHRTPLAFGKIRSPAIPWPAVLMRFVKPVSFCIWHDVCFLPDNESREVAVFIE
jgi:hypothetical protein